VSLALLKSIAEYVANTTTVDPAAILVDKQNLAQSSDSAVTVSSTAAGSEIAFLVNSAISEAFATNTGDVPCFVGITWSTSRLVDAVRFHWPSGTTPPTVKLQSWDGAWTDLPDAETWLLASGWNLLWPARGIGSVRGVRVVYVSGGAAVILRCSELEVYEDLRIEPRPSDWAAGGVFVTHPELDLHDLDVPILTLSTIPGELVDGEIGAVTREERTLFALGIHCATEEQLEKHRRWAQLILELAQSPEADGSLTAGLPLRGIRHPLTPTGTGDWWSSGQPRWFTSPAPVVYVDSVITAADATDLTRGRVQMIGVAATADVRADFTCGVWPFSVRGFVRSTIESPAQIQHAHNSYLTLESVGHYRAVQDALI
jgi:hypothetical protein